jgi:hypothetical protein
MSRVGHIKGTTWVSSNPLIWHHDLLIALETARRERRLVLADFSKEH